MVFGQRWIVAVRKMALVYSSRAVKKMQFLLFDVSTDGAPIEHPGRTREGCASTNCRTSHPRACAPRPYGLCLEYLVCFSPNNRRSRLCPMPTEMLRNKLNYRDIFPSEFGGRPDVFANLAEGLHWLDVKSKLILTYTRLSGGNQCLHASSASCLSMHPSQPSQLIPNSLCLWLQRTMWSGILFRVKMIISLVQQTVGPCESHDDREGENLQ
jgi:hypothetical protein